MTPDGTDDTAVASASTRRAVLLGLIVFCVIGLAFEGYRWSHRGPRDSTVDLLAMSAILASLAINSIGQLMKERRNVQRALTGVAMVLAITAIVLLVRNMLR